MIKQTQPGKPIQRQFFVILLTTLIGFMLISVASSFLFFWPEFCRQDTDNAIKDGMRVLHQWQDEVDDLKQKLADWAIWDDTYLFIQNRNEEYINSNLMANTFTNMAITDILYLRKDGSILWAGKTSADGQKIVPISKEMSLALQNFVPVAADGLFGFLSVNGSLHLTAMLPITDSLGEAPSNGTMVMTRLIDNAFLNSIRNSLRVDFTFEEGSARGIDCLTGNLDNMADKFTITQKQKINLVTYTVSLLTKGGVTVTITSPREIALKAKELFIWNGVAVLLSVILMLWLIGLFLKSRVILPLGHISEKVEGWESYLSTNLDLKRHETLEIDRITTAIVSMHNRIMKIASIDQLTGLPNRRLLDDRLLQAIARCQRYGGNFAVLYIDLDGFKPINDTHGHQGGDLVLKTISKRLLSSVRAADTVARLGGDEFIILIAPTPEDPPDLMTICKRTLRCIETPIFVDEAQCIVSGSIGVAIFPHDGTDAKELLRKADQAMYQAKRAGKATFRFAGTPVKEN